MSDLEIYLIQHAQSKLEQEDPTGPLTDEGRRMMEKVAAFSSKLRLDLDRIYHSGKLRAQQTAEILARHLQAAGRVQTQAGLGPLDDVQVARIWLAREAQEGRMAIAIVSHLPFLDKLASLLVAGNESAGVVAFQNAGIVKLIPKQQGGEYRVLWAFTPELADALG